MGGRRWGFGRELAALGAVSALLSGCAAAAAQEPLPPATYGTGINQLSLQATSSKPRVDEGTARKAIEHPAMAPAGSTEFVGLGLFDVSTGTLMGATGTLPAGGRFNHHLAWVGLYRVTSSGPISCGSGQTGTPKKRAQPHFAVIVDAQTGTEYEWTEDQHLNCAS